MSSKGAFSHVQLKTLMKRMGKPFETLPPHTALTTLLQHGGMSIVLDTAKAVRRLSPFLDAEPTLDANSAAIQMQSAAQNFFYRLVPGPGYQTNSDLISYLSYPFQGVTFEKPPKLDVSHDVPAAFTFIGQFIDHDLTMNGIDLFVDQTKLVANGASPLIDLDQMYGPRSLDAAHQAKIVDNNGQFIILKKGKNYYDLNRTPVASPVPKADPIQMADIVDNRDDENKILLQIHMLLERVHNKLVTDPALNVNVTGLTPAQAVTAKYDAARTELTKVWQTFVLTQYLPAVCEKGTLGFVLDEIIKPNFGALKHKPFLDLATGELIVQMPHEFGIGFRFGHSQLRPAYHLNPDGGKEVKLFDNLTADKVKGDLRGGVILPIEHAIDWDVFYPRSASPPDKTKSLRIDSKVTPPVFNLPESAIPDTIKTIGNLPQRNLIRSSMVGVVSGEELYDFYFGSTVPSYFPAGKKLQPNDIAPAEFHHLFMRDLDQNGNPVFKTPLWFYILKEAELQGNKTTLGILGSRLVAEVIAGAVYYDKNGFYFNENYATASAVTPQFTSIIPLSNPFTFHDLIDYVKDGGDTKVGP